MTDLTAEDLDELERVAKAATPGPWVVDEVVICSTSADRAVAMAILPDEFLGFDEDAIPAAVLEQHRSDWSFIALANPSTILSLLSSLRAAQARVRELEGALNTPELRDFASGVALEAAHQRQRWGAEHDAGKAPEDWFWLLGWLGGKAVHAAKSGDTDKALHHTISSAAVLANWHAALSGADRSMRPGIDPVARGYEARAALTQDDGEGR